MEDIKKYGSDNFEKEIIAKSEDCSEMNSLESELITLEFVRREDTYNIVVGGGTHYIRTQDSLNKCSISYKKFWEGLSEQSKMERIRKTTEGLKQYYARGNPNGFLGKKHTEETKRKMSEKAKIHSKGKRNSQYGTVWICNLELKQNKKIKKEELEKYTEEGWINGRKMKF
jgi:hypothetical protein